MSTTHNHGHNILRLFDTLRNFVFTTCEKSVIITNEHGTYEFPHELPNDLRLRKLGKIRTISKRHRILTLSPVFLPN